MERENVVIAPERLARQREIEQEIRAHLAETLDHTPLAYVDTFGCQQNVADSEHLMGMPVSYTHLTLPTICSV